MGPAGLTAVFGMGTGVTPPVWSPENRPRGRSGPPAAIFRWSVTGTNRNGKCRSNGKFHRSRTLEWHVFETNEQSNPYQGSVR